MGVLLLLFLVVPFVEFALLIEIGSRFGTLATLGLIFGTGVLGAALARHQGLQVLRAIETDLNAGRVPTEGVIDGILVLLAGAFLLAPGILTDTVGVLCLIPGTRALGKRALLRWLERRVRSGALHVDLHFQQSAWRSPSGPVYDITPDRPEPPPAPRRSASLPQPRSTGDRLP